MVSIVACNKEVHCWFSSDNIQIQGLFKVLVIVRIYRIMRRFVVKHCNEMSIVS